MEHAKHLVRAVLLILVVSAGFEIFRQTMKPASFGIMGHFRADAIAEAQAQPVLLGDSTQCASCHDDVFQVVQAGKHGKIDCQLCHAPVQHHIENDEKIAEMPQNRSAFLCFKCHEKLDGRPPSIQQIDISQHMEEQEITDLRQEGVCLDCHAVHEPNL